MIEITIDEPDASSLDAADLSFTKLLESIQARGYFVLPSMETFWIVDSSADVFSIVEPEQAVSANSEKSAIVATSDFLMIDIIKYPTFFFNIFILQLNYRKYVTFL